MILKISSTRINSSMILRQTPIYVRAVTIWREAAISANRMLMNTDVRIRFVTTVLYWRNAPSQKTVGHWYDIGERTIWTKCAMPLNPQPPNETFAPDSIWWNVLLPGRQGMDLRGRDSEGFGGFRFRNISRCHPKHHGTFVVREKSRIGTRMFIILCSKTVFRLLFFICEYSEYCLQL